MFDFNLKWLLRRFGSVVLLLYSKKVLGQNLLTWVLLCGVWILHVLHVPLIMRTLWVRLTGNSKLSMSASGCLSLCVIPAINWQPVSGLPLHLYP